MSTLFERGVNHLRNNTTKLFHSKSQQLMPEKVYRHLASFFSFYHIKGRASVTIPHDGTHAFEDKPLAITVQ